MQFYFIRHGQSENNALWERGGPQGDRRADPELTELGHVQAQHLARFLAQNCVPCELSEEGGYGAAAPSGARTASASLTTALALPPPALSASTTSAAAR